MWELTKRISLRNLSVLAKVEPVPDLNTGSDSDQKVPAPTGSGSATLLREYSGSVTGLWQQYTHNLVHWGYPTPHLWGEGGGHMAMPVVLTAGQWAGQACTWLLLLSGPAHLLARQCPHNAAQSGEISVIREIWAGQTVSNQPLAILAAFVSSVQLSLKL